MTVVVLTVIRVGNGSLISSGVVSWIGSYIPMDNSASPRSTFHYESKLSFYGKGPIVPFVRTFPFTLVKYDKVNCY